MSNLEKTKRNLAFSIPHSLFSKFSNGYTFIEILVALTLVALIFGIGYVNFRDFSRRQALTGVARSIMGDLRLAQEQALSGKKPASLVCNSPNSLDGYYFRVVSAQNYVLEANCTGGTVQTKTVTIASDISMSTPSPNPILFKVLGKGTNISGPSAILTLTQAQTSYSRTITVTLGGEIK